MYPHIILFLNSEIKDGRPFSPTWDRRRSYRRRRSNKKVPSKKNRLRSRISFWPRTPKQSPKVRSNPSMPTPPSSPAMNSIWFVWRTTARTRLRSCSPRIWQNGSASVSALSLSAQHTSFGQWRCRWPLGLSRPAHQRTLSKQVTQITNRILSLFTKWLHFVLKCFLLHFNFIKGHSVLFSVFFSCAAKVANANNIWCMYYLFISNYFYRTIKLNRKLTNIFYFVSLQLTVYTLHYSLHCTNALV